MPSGNQLRQDSPPACDNFGEIPFAESASWNRVIRRLCERELDVVAVANPLRGVAPDAAYLRDVIASPGRPVILAGHSDGGTRSGTA